MNSNRSNPPQNFQDPLENYDPPTYDDPLEQALQEQTVAAIRTQPYASISPEATIESALQKLARGHIACLLVEQQGRLVGVFSDRDFLDKVALEYDQLKAQPVSSVMTRDPVFVFETDSAASALCVMAVSGFRHVPVIDMEHQVVGIVSPQRVTSFLREQSRNA